MLLAPSHLNSNDEGDVSAVVLEKHVYRLPVGSGAPNYISHACEQLSVDAVNQF